MTEHAAAPARHVGDALRKVRTSFAGLQFPFELRDAQRGKALSRQAMTQLDDYLIPRYEALDAPLLAVVGGSTGAGKSTLVNSLLGTNVSHTSAIRPTTRRPVLIHHPDDTSWFEGSRILPDLARVRRGIDERMSPVEEGSTSEVEIRATRRVPPGLALLDAPDIDSVEEKNRALARQLLSAADLWIFTTTAARYADAAPWEFLSEAARRKVVVAVVLNRVPSGAAYEVRSDLTRRLTDAGLAQAPVFTIGEQNITDTGRIPVESIEPIVGWLKGLTDSAATRAMVARTTLAGALDELVRTGADAIDASRDTISFYTDLARRVDDSYADAHSRITEATKDGSMLRGEVLARWQEFVGTGDFIRSIEAAVGRMRDRLGAFFKGKPAPEAEVEEAIETGLFTLLAAEASRAGSEVDYAWQREPAARELLMRAHINLPPRSELDDRAAQTVRAWQRDVLEMVRSEGEDRRFSARMMSLGVNTLGIALMLVILASTGGVITGMEVAAAGGTAVVGQKLLEAVFGDEAVRKMARNARKNLEERAGELLAWHAQAYRSPLTDLGLDPAAPDTLHDALIDLSRARKAEGLTA
ncbi:Dynamin family protein [Bowdeniella nasicola]|uniref:Dynamin family protein n=1 Tax=Bowdeniella nasicola TaxID=208480 RepID=A0A1H3WHR1_9ACTO|nr:dynamin family protein [Bowdeniella nasicola]SDZ86697.1 Dynamin family protein [Bowdeniella nasicola]